MTGPVRVTPAAGFGVLGVDPLVVAPAEREERLELFGDDRARLVTQDGTARPLLLIWAAQVPGGARRAEVVIDGWRIEVEVEPESRAALRERARRGPAASPSDGPAELRAIIPGRVVSVAVVEGDTVHAGQALLVVEAMKMQNELRAPRDGTVRRVAAAVGSTIEVGDLLAVLE